MIATGLGALLSHWRKRPFQLLTLILGLATATALWSGVQAINAEARASYDTAATTLTGGPEESLARADGQPIPQDAWLALRRAGHPVSPVIEDELDGLRLIGVEPFSLPRGGGPVAPDGLSDAFFTPPGQLLVAPGTEVPAGLPEPVEAADIPPGTAYADIGIAQSLLGRAGEIDRLIVTGPPALGAPPLDRIAPDLEVQENGASDIARLTGSFHLNLTAFGFLSFAVGLFIVRGAVGLAFEQRRGMFRTLRALGLPRVTLLALLCAELMILALLAGALGVALGWGIAAALMPDVAATLRGLYGANVSGGLSLRPEWWLSGLGIAVAGTALSAASILWQTWVMPLLAPAQPRAWARAGARAMRWQALAAFAFLAAGALILWRGEGVVMGFLLLGALLLGAALLLPILLDLVLSALSPLATGPRRDWALADTRQQLPGLSLALMALLLALATNIGVGTMVSSFRATFTGWLDQRLAAELYVEAADEAQASDLVAFLELRADAILPIRSVEAELAGAPGDIFGVADHATYRDNWPLIASRPGVWDEVAAGTAILINEQLSRREELSPGDTLDLPGWAAAPIAGVYSDYGNPMGQAMVGMDRFGALFPGDPTRFGIRADNPDALADEIRTEIGVPASRITDQAGIKALSLSIFERTFAVTAALNVLTLGVAGIAILTSLLTLASMRLPQLAPAWALGITRRRLAGMELVRALVLALLTFVFALPVGIALAWALLAVVNVEAFGWRLPLVLFPGDWLWLLLAALLAAGLAALWPARKLARTPPSDLLKEFANER